MRTITKAAIAAFVFAVPTAPAFAQALPDAKIAVVDSDRILRECTACRAASTQLQAQQTQFETLARQQLQPLQTEQTALQTALQTANGNPDAALQGRIRTFQQRQQQIQGQLAPQEQQLQRNAAYVQQQIGQRLVTVIGTVSQQRGATLTVPKGNTFFNAPAVEITDAVLTSLNQQLPSVNVVAPAQAPAPAGATPPAAGARPATAPQGR